MLPFRYGRLGVGGEPDVLPPSVVGGLRGANMTAVACGTAHTLALTNDGRVYAWGYNGNGALGLSDMDNRLVPVQVRHQCRQCGSSCQAPQQSINGAHTACHLPDHNPRAIDMHAAFD